MDTVKSTDGQTVRRTYNVKPVYPPFNFVEARGMINMYIARDGCESQPAVGLSGPDAWSYGQTIEFKSFSLILNTLVGLLEIWFQRPGFESYIQQRKTTCLLLILFKSKVNPHPTPHPKLKIKFEKKEKNRDLNLSILHLWSKFGFLVWTGDELWCRQAQNGVIFLLPPPLQNELHCQTSNIRSPNPKT